MIQQATSGYFGSAGFILLVFFVFLKLRGVGASQAIWLPLGGLVWSAVLSAILALPWTVARPPYAAAFEAVAPWLNLIVVHI